MLAYNNYDCDMFWVALQSRTICLGGGQTPNTSTFPGACALSLEITGLSGHVNMGACLLFHNDCDYWYFSPYQVAYVWVGGRAGLWSHIGYMTFGADADPSMDNVGLGACL